VWAGLAATASFGASTILGSWIVNDPPPGSLSTVMSPPIIWQKRRLMARPRLVQPYFLAVVEEAWENSWNSLPICSGVIPMPVSITASVIQPHDYFSLFSSLFFFDPPNRFVQIPRDLS
jgi:hypothetical protein